MLGLILRTRRPRRALAVLCVTGLLGCAHVNPDELDSRLADLRADLQGQMAEGDEDLSGQITDLQERVNGVEGRMEALEQELENLARQFEAEVERLEEAVRFNVPVHFGFDEAEVSMAQQEVLDRFADVVREYYPRYLITVEGFTDPVGTVEYNESLGMRRARSVAGYLTDVAGLTPDRVRAVSYGEASNRLVAPGRHGPGEEGRPNRRVALVVERAGG